MKKTYMMWFTPEINYQKISKAIEYFTNKYGNPSELLISKKVEENLVKEIGKQFNFLVDTNKYLSKNDILIGVIEKD